MISHLDRGDGFVEIIVCPGDIGGDGSFVGGVKHQVPPLIAVFDYNQQAAAHDKLADLLANKKGIHFLQIVKDPMPEPALAGAPSLR